MSSPKVKQAELVLPRQHHVSVVWVGVNDASLKQLGHAAVHTHLHHCQLLSIVELGLVKKIETGRRSEGNVMKGEVKLGSRDREPKK